MREVRTTICRSHALMVAVCKRSFVTWTLLHMAPTIREQIKADLNKHIMH
jgi:hypothetical protein